ncbi:MAG: thiamine-phosphate kinase [Bradyrhizobiaceae bacterium]|nr:thiamine-phosphate kinase [Bradyrhizobiaceae bacterium]
MSSRQDGRSGEDRLIDRFFRPIAKHPGALGLVDDAAFLTPPEGSDLVLTVDAVVSGVHFFADDAADLVAKKALRVNLSDLAAKGAKPLGALLSLSMPENTGNDWLQAFARGLGEDCDAFDCPLLGGDTTGTPGSLTISVTALGAVPTGKMVKRSGALPGDVLVVTGTIGDAVLGLKLRHQPDSPAFARLNRTARAHLGDRYLMPQPRLVLARSLHEQATAAIDISDGLAGDVGKLAAASGVAARIEAKRIPFSAPARAVLAEEPGLIEAMLGGGDDYEIAAAVPENHFKALQAAGAEAGVDVTAIGRIEAGEGVTVLGLDGQPLSLKQASFSHF